MRSHTSAISAIVAIGLLAGSAVGVGAQEAVPDPMAAAWVSGTIGFAPSCEDPTITRGDDGVTRARGYLCTPQTWTTDDPRLGGAATVTWNADVHRADGRPYSVISYLYDIRGEGGGWRCADTAALERGDGLFTTPVQQTGSLDCTGDGANDGLGAILVTDFTSPPFTVEGLIYPGDTPPLPELSRDDGSSGDGSVDAASGETTAAEMATVVDVTEVDERIRDLTIDSPSVGTKMVRLMLPDGFDEDVDRTWPVLYLLHGQGGSHLDWTTHTSIARRLGEELDALLVMPDAGAGYYSDWWNGGEGGPPMWETFHITELLPILEADWRAGDRRALAGISMGGFGAMSYAARHPDLFEAAASYSGVLYPLGSAWEHDPALWGDKLDQADVWQAHDPVTLAPALAETDLYVWWGDGTLDGEGPVVDGLEAFLSSHSAAFAARLEDLGIDATVESGPGTHAWSSWDDAVLRSLPLLRSALEG